MENLEVQLARIDERSKRNEGRIKHLEEHQEALQELASSVKIIAEGQKRIENDVSNLTDKVDAIEQQDGKKWRALVDKVVSLLAAALVGYAPARVGLG